VRLLSKIPASLSAAVLGAVLVWGCSNGSGSAGFKVEHCDGVAIVAEEGDRVATMMVYTACQVESTDFELVDAQEMLERQAIRDALGNLERLGAGDE